MHVAQGLPLVKCDDITEKYFSKVVTSYATANRSGDGEGDGPGSLANFLVCMGLYNAGMAVPKAEGKHG